MSPFGSIPPVLFLFPPLVTLGVGFWIFANAPSLKASYRKWGQGIGLVIMAAAIGGFVVLASCLIKNGITCRTKSCPHYQTMESTPPSPDSEDWQKYNVIPPENPASNP